MLTKVMSKNIPAENGPPIPGEVRRIYLDCGRAQKELGWMPATSLAEGLEKTRTWFDSRASKN